MPQQKKEEASRAREIQFVIFCLAGEEFGIDISQVREIIRVRDITPVPKALEFIEGIINLRGQIIAVMDLAKRFGLEKVRATEKTRIIVGEVKDSAVGLIVDEVPEVLRISEDNIDPTPEMIGTQIHAEFIRGVGKFEDRLVILLDLDKILSSEEMKKISEAGSTELHNRE